MIQTVKFRLHPSDDQVKVMNEMFVIYNKMKRIGYNLLFNGETGIQQKLMERCGNNPYVNTILIENKTKLKTQKTWLQKRITYLKHKIDIIKEKIEQVKRNDLRDRRLRGLYSRLSSLQDKLLNVKLEPIVFGGKALFRARILNKLSREEFKIMRDASFSCVGKVQGINLNLKVLPTRELKIRTFSKEKARKWIIVPFSTNGKQKEWLKEILGAKKYSVTVKRMFVKKELRYYAHFTYEAPELSMQHSFENGAIGLDFNHNFVALANVDENGNLLSYLKIPFRNLHSYRMNKRNDYISFKMDKVVNYCLNKRKGLVIENLAFNQHFSYNKKLNRKLSNLKTSALDVLKRKCGKKGIDVREIHPAYTSLIGKYKYSRSHNLSGHVLASYVIARRGLGFKEPLPAIYRWLLSRVGDLMKPRLKKSSPYHEWSRVHDLFKHCGITSFKTPEMVRKVPLMKDVLNSATSAQPDNLRAGPSSNGEMDENNKILDFYTIIRIL